MQYRDRYKGDIPTMELPVHTPGFRPGAYKATSDTAQLISRIDASVISPPAKGLLPETGRQLVPDMQRAIGPAMEAENRLGQRIRDTRGRPIRAQSISESLVSAVEYVSSAKFTDPESGETIRLRLAVLHCGEPVCRRFVFTNAPLSALSEFGNLVDCMTNMRSIRLDKPPGTLRFLFMTHRDAERAIFDFCKSHPATESAVAAAESIRESAPSIDLPAPSPKQYTDAFGNRVARPICEAPPAPEEASQKPGAGKPASRIYSILAACRISTNYLNVDASHFRDARAVKDPELERRFRDATCRVGGVETPMLPRLVEIIVGTSKYLLSKGIHPAKIADGSRDAAGELSFIDPSMYACFVRPDPSGRVSEQNCVYLIRMPDAEGSSFSITPSRASFFETPAESPRLSPAEELVILAHNSVREFARGFGASWTPEDEFIGDGGDFAILAIRGGEHQVITNMHFTEATARLEGHLSSLSTRMFLTPSITQARSHDVLLPNGGKVRITVMPCEKAERQLDEDTPLPTPLVIPVAAALRGGSTDSGPETGAEASVPPASGGPALPTNRPEFVEFIKGAVIYAPPSSFFDPAEERLFETRMKFFSSLGSTVAQASEHRDSNNPLGCTSIMTSGNFWFYLFRLNCRPESLPEGLLNIRNSIIFSKGGGHYIMVESRSITPDVRQLLLENAAPRSGSA